MATELIDCATCDGKGMLTKHVQGDTICFACGATGRVAAPRKKCEVCKGHGVWTNKWPLDTLCYHCKDGFVDEPTEMAGRNG